LAYAVFTVFAFVFFVYLPRFNGVVGAVAFLLAAWRYWQTGTVQELACKAAN